MDCCETTEIRTGAGWLDQATSIRDDDDDGACLAMYVREIPEGRCKFI